MSKTKGAKKAKVAEKVILINESERVSESHASGDFVYIRDFTMTDKKGTDLNGDPTVNGYILQKITKSVNVEVTDAKKGEPSTLTTTQDVMNYTGGFVNSMSDSYIEAFVVINGNVTEGDMFRNSSILRYNKKAKKIADDAPDTKGVITQIGQYYFVPSTNTTKIAILEELAGEDIVIITSKKVPNPANGLPCSTDISLFEKLRPKKKGPVYQFLLTVTWDFNDEDSIIEPKPASLIGGGNKRMTKKNTNIRGKLQR